MHLLQRSEPLEKRDECALVIIAQTRFASTEKISPEVVSPIHDQVGTFA